jgi:hypothetical protein
MDLNKIIAIGKKIGFSSDSNSYSFPCKIKLSNKNEMDFITILFCSLITENNQVKIEDIRKIEKSNFALSKKMRDSSLHVQDFKGDRPFFLRTSKGLILGYNAINLVDFTFSSVFKSKDIVSGVDFDTARMEGFEFIENHHKQGITLTIELTDEIKERINK